MTSLSPRRRRIGPPAPQPLLAERLERGVRFRLPLCPANPLNGQVYNSVRGAMLGKRQRASEKETARVLTIAACMQVGLSPSSLLPCEVTLVRLSTGRWDDDGVSASCKWIRDGIAKAIGVDDGSPSIRFLYDKRSEGRGVRGLEVTIERMT